MTQGAGQTFAPATTTPTTVAYIDSDNSEADQSPVDRNTSPSLTDTIAAVTIAVLACVLIIVLVIIIKALHRRRAQTRGRQLDAVPTISTGIVSANVSAYGGHNTPRPVNNVITWEPVVQSANNTDVSVPPSSSGSPNNC